MTQGERGDLASELAEALADESVGAQKVGEIYLAHADELRKLTPAQQCSIANYDSCCQSLYKFL